MDMALLSHCDDMVVTMASSFGYVALPGPGMRQSTWCMESTPVPTTHTGTGEPPRIANKFLTRRSLRFGHVEADFHVSLSDIQASWESAR